MIDAKIVIRTSYRDIELESKVLNDKQDINDLLWAAREILSNDLQQSKELKVGKEATNND